MPTPPPRRLILATAALSALVALNGCAGVESPAAPTSAPSVLPSSSAVPSASSAPAPPTDAQPTPDEIEGTVVRFAVGSTAVDVVIGADNPTVRDFLSLLPTTTRWEEFAGREKIAYLSRELEVSGSPGSDPEDGDLIYYSPWGNLGFYYNAAGIGYTDQTIHLGTFTATAEQLSALDGADITISVVD